MWHETDGRKRGRKCGRKRGGIRAPVILEIEYAVWCTHSLHREKICIVEKLSLSLHNPDVHM